MPLDAVLSELEGKLSLQPDYITLSGSGEPTLYSRLDELIDHIKDMTNIPVAVLTNGSLFWQEDVRQQLAAADLVMPSLDAGDPTAFHLVNRPHESITFGKRRPGHCLPGMLPWSVLAGGAAGRCVHRLRARIWSPFVRASLGFSRIGCCWARSLALRPGSRICRFQISLLKLSCHLFAASRSLGRPPQFKPGATVLSKPRRHPLTSCPPPLHDRRHRRWSADAQD